WAATASRPGVNLLPDLSEATAAHLGEHARHDGRPGDVLIASVHWGDNWGYGIPASHQRFAHALIDHGFDLVHGHSSHHAKGIELHRGKLVLYGCGDLLDDYEGITGHEAFRGDLALMYLPELDSATGRLISLEMLPLQIRRFRLNRASPGDAAWLAEVIARESARLGTAVGMRGDGRIVVEAGGT
ncbi:MAG TPA: poly-gamma-glutamate biosynthesis protein, partial [Alphaproteobacteria bacterium]|nr:poly-gamma-glutamate biosynthesis protein [Alphaproteobacteria bacterium]